MNKKTLIALIAGGVIMLALVCLLIGLLAGQMPWDESEEYEYDPTETIDPDGPQPTEETTVPTEPVEETTVPPTTQGTLPNEDEVKVEVEVQLPTTAPTNPTTQPTDPSTGTEATTPSTEATTPSTEATQPSQDSTTPTNKDTTQVEDENNEQVGDKGFWDIFG